MPKIFDNVENHLVEGLKNTLKVSYRGDFCVGYFNLRGWKQVAVQIDNLKGDDGNCCRLLIGMQQPLIETIRKYFYATAPAHWIYSKEKRLGLYVDDGQK